MNKKPIPGDFRHPIKLQRYIELPLGDTETQRAWETIGNYWAFIEPIKGLVYFDSQQISKGVSHRIIIRYDKNQEITSEHWILYREQRYRIRNILSILEERRYLEILCEVEFQVLQNFDVDESHVGDALRNLIED